MALFVVCLTMQEDTEENRRTVEGYLDPLREKAPGLEPVNVGLFAGVFEPKRLSFFLRVLMQKMTKAPEGDFRDWDAIREWAKSLQPAFAVT